MNMLIWIVTGRKNEESPLGNVISFTRERTFAAVCAYHFFKHMIYILFFLSLSLSLSRKRKKIFSSTADDLSRRGSSVLVARNFSTSCRVNVYPAISGSARGTLQARVGRSGFAVRAVSPLCRAITSRVNNIPANFKRSVSNRGRIRDSVSRGVSVSADFELLSFTGRLIFKARNFAIFASSIAVTFRRKSNFSPPSGPLPLFLSFFFAPFLPFSPRLVIFDLFCRQRM